MFLFFVWFVDKFVLYFIHRMFEMLSTGGFEFKFNLLWLVFNQMCLN